MEEVKTIHEDSEEQQPNQSVKQLGSFGPDPEDSQKRTLAANTGPQCIRGELTQVVSVETLNNNMINVRSIGEENPSQTSVTQAANYNSMKILQQVPSRPTLSCKTNTRRREVI